MLEFTAEGKKIEYKQSVNKNFGLQNSTEPTVKAFHCQRGETGDGRWMLNRPCQAFHLPTRKTCGCDRQMDTDLVAYDCRGR